MAILVLIDLDCRRYALLSEHVAHPPLQPNHLQRAGHIPQRRFSPGLRIDAFVVHYSQ